MARLTASQKAMLNNIRSNNFVNARKGKVKPRHPEKPVTIYNEGSSEPCVIEPKFSKRPKKLMGTLAPLTTATLSQGVTQAANRASQATSIESAELFKRKFMEKLDGLGLSIDQWNEFKELRKSNIELTVASYKSGLLDENIKQ